MKEKRSLSYNRKTNKDQDNEADFIPHSPCSVNGEQFKSLDSAKSGDKATIAPEDNYIHREDEWESETADEYCFPDTVQIKLHSSVPFHGSLFAASLHGIVVSLMLFCITFFSALFVGGHLNLPILSHGINIVTTLIMLSAYCYGERFFSRKKYGGRLSVAFFLTSTLLFVITSLFTLLFDFSVFPLGMGDTVKRILLISGMYINITLAASLIVRIVLEIIYFVRDVKEQD